jgi:hypothetical protein
MPEEPKAEHKKLVSWLVTATTCVRNSWTPSLEHKWANLLEAKEEIDKAMVVINRQLDEVCAALGDAPL